MNLLKRLCAPILVLAALGAACAGAPDATPPVSGEHPVIHGRSGPLSRQETAAILRKVEREAGESDILSRHLAVEEALAGSPLVAGNKATLLHDGPATFRSMFDAIAGARDHVNVEFFIIDDEGIGKEFADLLIRKRLEGVAVHLIYDSVGSLDASSGYFERLKQAGIEVVEYNPLNPVKAGTDWSPNHRDHRKVLIVDGRIGFTGGINVSVTYGDRNTKFSKKDGSVWRDTQVRIEGPVVAELQKLFIEQWTRAGGAALGEGRYFPKVKPAGDELVRILGTNADENGASFMAALVSALRTAEKTIHITQAYFAPPDEELEALKDAARRGVDVQLVLPQKSDQPKVVFAGRTRYQELLDAGVKIFERRDVMLHAKTAVIDGVWSTVGSANHDYRSVLWNDEVVAIVLGTRFGEALEKKFVDDVTLSNQLDPKTWAKRPFVDRVKEFLAQMLYYWL
jgi:cardiolipin synthase